MLNKTNILSVHERSKQSVYQDPREQSDPEDEDVFDRSESPQKARSQNQVQSSRGFLDEQSFRLQNGRMNGMEPQAASGNQGWSSRTSKCSLPSDQRGLISLGYQNPPSGNTPQHTGRYDTEFESGPALPGNALQNLQAGESLLDLEGLPLKPVHPNKPLNKHDKELEDFLAASSPVGGLKPQKLGLGQSRLGAEPENKLPSGLGKLQAGHGQGSFSNQPYQSERSNKEAAWGEDFSQSHHDSKTYEAFDEDDEDDPQDLLGRLAHSRAMNARNAGLL